jgi:hypothetical protein
MYKKNQFTAVFFKAPDKFFFLMCKNMLTLIGKTHFANDFCITEIMISGVFKKKTAA